MSTFDRFKMPKKVKSKVGKRQLDFFKKLTLASIQAKSRVAHRSEKVNFQKVEGQFVLIYI